jgi:dynein heavy chain
VKEEMLKTGCSEQKATTFLLTDTQIIEEGFLEDINNLLNTGEITGLYNQDDKNKIEDCLGEILTKKKLPVNKESCMQSYTETLRDNFHIILAMSPIGDSLRGRSLKFPALISCNTLVWFDTWPHEALNEVATSFLGRLREDELDSESKKVLAEMFPKIHSSVEQTVDLFYEELRRKTYVTPKSYLDGIVLYLDNLEEIRSKARSKISRL